MPKITKTASGLILFDDFSVNNLIWSLSPNNYNNIEFNNGLRIFHNSEYTTMSITEPGRNYSFICKLRHIPVDYTDIGGVIVMGNSTNYAECQSYMADTPSAYTNSSVTEEAVIKYVDQVMKDYVQYSIDAEDIPLEDPVPSGTENTDTTTEAGTSDGTGFVDVVYPYIKFNKQNDLYSFFASKDGVEWIEIGNTEIPDSNRIGFFLYGESSANTLANGSFIVEYVAMYNNNFIVFDGIKPEQNIEIRQEDRIVCTDSSLFTIRNKNQIIIDTTTLLMPLDNLRFIVLQDGQIIHEHPIEKIYGGDSYNYGHNITVSANNQELDPERLFYLGEFNHNDKTVKIDIYNNEIYAIQNLKISISAYSVYYGGEETMSVSLYDENQINYDFKKSVVIPEIAPSEGRSILFKLTNKLVQDFYKAAGSYRFKISIE